MAKKVNKISWAHFYPSSFWSVDDSGPTYNNGIKKFIIDSSTKDKYLNETSSTIRIKCFLLLLGTPLIHLIASAVKIITNLFKFIFMYDLWKTHSEAENKGYQFFMRLSNVGVRLLHIIFAPIAIVLLEISALYGMIMPRDGRKLYASLERFSYKDAVLAPCFQPEPTSHLLGGDMNKQNAM